MNTQDAHNLGTKIRNARIEAGKDISTIAKEICVCKNYLIAIEEGHFEQLPAHAFALGFVRSFARAVDLDEEKTVSSFKDIVRPAEDEEQESEETSPEVSNAAGRFGSQKKSIYTIIASSLSAMAGVWFVFFGSAPQLADNKNIESPQAVQAVNHDNIKKTPDSNASMLLANANAENGSVPEIGHGDEKTYPVAGDQFADSKTVDDTISDGAGSVQNEHDFTVTIEAKQDSWVRISNDTAVFFEGILRAGDHYAPPPASNLSLTTTNAGGLSLRIGEENLGLLGAKGAIVENVQIGNRDLVLKLAERL